MNNKIFQIVTIFLFSIIITFLVFIFSLQNIKIYNLEKEVDKLSKYDEIIKQEIVEVENQNKRYLDSCLNILLNKVWEEGDNHLADGD